MRSGRKDFDPTGIRYYDDLFAEITDHAFARRTFAFSPALVEDNGTLSKYRSEPFDASQYRLDPEGWTHEHCYVCHFCIDVGCDYWENSEDDCLCGVCYEAYFRRTP